MKRLYFCCIILSALTGCASLNSNTPFRYQPSLISQTSSIERFTWKLYTTPLGFIPLVGYLGVPTLKGEGIATIVLEVRDAKTDTVIATLRESAKVENYFTVYNFKIGDSGTELEDAFREVGRKLKEGLLTRINWKGNFPAGTI